MPAQLLPGTTRAPSLLLLDPEPRFFLQSEPIQQKDGKIQPLGLVALIALYTMGKPVLASGRGG
jgi:hypothetical protein